MEWADWVYFALLGIASLYAAMLAVGGIAAALLLFIASVHNAVTLYAGWYRRIVARQPRES